MRAPSPFDGSVRFEAVSLWPPLLIRWPAGGRVH